MSRSSSPYQTPHCRLSTSQGFVSPHCLQVQGAPSSAPLLLCPLNLAPSSSICSAPRLISFCPNPLISPDYRPVSDTRHNHRGCAVTALSCPSFGAVQHRLAASHMLRFCLLAPSTKPVAEPPTSVLSSPEYQLSELDASRRTRRILHLNKPTLTLFYPIRSSLAHDGRSSVDRWELHPQPSAYEISSDESSQRRSIEFCASHDPIQCTSRCASRHEYCGAQKSLDSRAATQEQASWTDGGSHIHTHRGRVSRSDGIHQKYL